ncbi:MAG TPA: lamin tail domain-containing protein, partial [Candidatus Methylacidiphilales bacterium]
MRHLCLFFLLSCSQLAFADPVISEFMASNKHGLTDEDGKHSDWIEIYNPDETPANLDGWYLTDSASNLEKWAFPAVTLAPKSYLVVFASGNNRRVVGQPLHTNFSLSVDGEYLALVKPDGVTKTTEFAPAFPAQVEDVSYGTSSSVETVTLCQQGSPLRAIVPSSASLGTSWRDRGFDDSAWASGSLAVGFFNYGHASNPDLSASLGLDLKAQMGGQARSAYIRVPFSTEAPEKILRMKLRMKYDDGFAAFINGQTAASGNSPTIASLSYNSFALEDHGPTSFEEFDVSALIPSLVPGANVLAIQSMNQNVGSSDAYALPELTAEIETDIAPVTGYFPNPTPGAQNGGPDSVQLPQKVAFSRPPGTFTTAFSLALSGAAAGQQIRYVIADPSASPGADIPEPTAASTLYAGAIAITSSKL